MLAHRSPYNFVQIDVPDPNSGSSRYRTAADKLAGWRAGGILRRDTNPALYRYHQEFTDHQQNCVVTRKGLIAAVALSPWNTGIIRPHETTFTAPREDRARLLDTTRVHLSPVFAMYEDQAGDVEQFLGTHDTTPDLLAKTDDGTLHRVWRVADTDTIGKLSQFMNQKCAYVLDGHHRYETMVAFGDRELMRAEPRLGSQRGLMFLVPMSDPGLIVLPTHRVVHSVPSFTRNKFLADVQSHFRVEPISGGARSAAKLRDALTRASGAPTLFAAVFPRDPDAHLLSSIDRGPRSNVEPEVSVLHNLILERILAISVQAGGAETNLRYVSDTQVALDQIAQEHGQLALIMRPPTLMQIKQIADLGQVMPQKSTYFFPKLASGLVMMPVE